MVVVVVVAVFFVWCVVCGVWCVVCGVWCVVCGVWCVVCGVWLMHYSVFYPCSCKEVIPFPNSNARVYIMALPMHGSHITMHRVSVTTTVIKMGGVGIIFFCAQ